MHKNFIIIDGNSLLFRAYYATAFAGPESIMRTTKGQPTNAIFAFANMMTKILNGLDENDHLFVAFDTGEKTFRHEEYDDYKAGRQQVPEELISQFPIAREFLDALSIKRGEINGFEADDIAGSLAVKAASEGYHVYLYTSDQDYLQLISDNISVHLIRKGLSDLQTLTPERLYTDFGFHSFQVTDYKGLVGDASDNLKGIPGVGKVTALKLLAKYENIAGVEKVMETIPGKLGENIRENIEVAKTSKYLATIVTSIPIPHALDHYHYQGFDSEIVSAFAQKYELRQLLNNLKITHKPLNAVKLVGNYLPFFINDLNPNYVQVPPTEVYYYYEDKLQKATFSEILNTPHLKALFTEGKYKLLTFDYKRALLQFKAGGLTLSDNFDDVLIMSYVFNTNISNNLPGFLTNFNISSTKEDDLAALLVTNLATIYSECQRRLREDKSEHLYLTIEKPLINVLAKMEEIGFDVDEKFLKTLGEKYRTILDELTVKIFNLAGHEFNVNSPAQVATIIFDELKLTSNKKRSTAVDILNALKDEHEIIPLLLEYRKYQKIMSTYIEGLVPHIHADGKIHTSFNQALTTTGRLSSANPNLQNISVRSEEGREIRKAFHAQKNEILSIDYSQIELRLLSSIAEVDTLLTVFKENRDVHTETASRLFPLEDEDYARRKAKAVNFGIVYGLSDFGLSEQLEISVPEAKSIIQSFFSAYPEIWSYRQNTISELQKNGYVQTITGRKRFLPQINDANYQTREFAKRAAINAPIQGSAADLIKLAMIKVDDFLMRRKAKSKLILQVHDELIFTLDPLEKDLIPEIVAIMENVFDLNIELKVSVSVGKTWFDAS